VGSCWLPGSPMAGEPQAGDGAPAVTSLPHMPRRARGTTGNRSQRRTLAPTGLNTKCAGAPRPTSCEKEERPSSAPQERRRSAKDETAVAEARRARSRAEARTDGRKSSAVSARASGDNTPAAGGTDGCGSPEVSLRQGILRSGLIAPRFRKSSPGKNTLPTALGKQGAKAPSPLPGDLNTKVASPGPGAVGAPACSSDGSGALPTSRCSGEGHVEDPNALKNFLPSRTDRNDVSSSRSPMPGARELAPPGQGAPRPPSGRPPAAPNSRRLRVEGSPSVHDRPPRAASRQSDEAGSLGGGSSGQVAESPPAKEPAFATNCQQESAARLKAVMEGVNLTRDVPPEQRQKEPPVSKSRIKEAKEAAEQVPMFQEVVERVPRINFLHDTVAVTASSGGWDVNVDLVGGWDDNGGNDYDEHFALSAYCEWGAKFTTCPATLEETGPAQALANDADCAVCQADGLLVRDGREPSGADPFHAADRRSRGAGILSPRVSDDEGDVSGRRRQSAARNVKLHSVQCTARVYTHNLMDRLRDLRFEGGRCLKNPKPVRGVLPPCMADVVAQWKKKGLRPDVKEKSSK